MIDLPVSDAGGGWATWAIGRVIAKLAPSQQGGERKDSVIVEEGLDRIRQHRASAFARNGVFRASSANDDGHPDPTLAADFPPGPLSRRRSTVARREPRRTGREAFGLEEKA
jgi:hypothetical protein